jgi:hypothetical protein
LVRANAKKVSESGARENMNLSAYTGKHLVPLASSVAMIIAASFAAAFNLSKTYEGEFNFDVEAMLAALNSEYA